MTFATLQLPKFLSPLYETNLIRRLSGLLYIDNKTMGAIKEKIKKNSTE